MSVPALRPGVLGKGIRLRGPYWATARLHRGILWTGLGLVIAAALVMGGLRVSAAVWPEPDQRDCAGPCPSGLLGFPTQELLRLAATYCATALLLLPPLVGALVAGPLIARELESGTHRLVWAQSLSPARWLASKLAVMAAAAVCWALCLMAVFQLAGPSARGTWNLRWPDRGAYEATGPALVAYCLFAVTAGALIGLLVRRTLLAMSAAALVTGAVLFGVGSVRWDIWPVSTLTGAGGTGRSSPAYAPVPRDSFLMETGLRTASGGRISTFDCWRRFEGIDPCAAQVHATGWYADFHPYSHFWWVQLAETGLVLVLAAAAGCAAFRVLHRRTV